MGVIFHSSLSLARVHAVMQSRRQSVRKLFQEVLDLPGPGYVLKVLYFPLPDLLQVGALQVGLGGCLGRLRLLLLRLWPGLGKFLRELQGLRARSRLGLSLWRRLGGHRGTPVTVDAVQLLAELLHLLRHSLFHQQPLVVKVWAKDAQLDLLAVLLLVALHSRGCVLHDARLSARTSVLRVLCPASISGRGACPSCLCCRRGGGGDGCTRWPFQRRAPTPATAVAAGPRLRTLLLGKILHERLHVGLPRWHAAGRWRRCIVLRLLLVRAARRLRRRGLGHVHAGVAAASADACSCWGTIPGTRGGKPHRVTVPCPARWYRRTGGAIGPNGWGQRRRRGCSNGWTLQLKVSLHPLNEISGGLIRLVRPAAALRGPAPHTLAHLPGASCHLDVRLRVAARQRRRSWPPWQCIRRGCSACGHPRAVATRTGRRLGLRVLRHHEAHVLLPCALLARVLWSSLTSRGSRRCPWRARLGRVHLPQHLEGLRPAQWLWRRFRRWGEDRRARRLLRPLCMEPRIATWRSRRPRSARGDTDAPDSAVLVRWACQWRRHATSARSAAPRARGGDVGYTCRLWWACGYGLDGRAGR
mmetsp:Transcript_11740/g.37612  ORF Transcript_11740/g.37612 Transcript_11740/m.37612 type:complete len:585 (+) Transcript_11740:78-1832(+)